MVSTGMKGDAAAIRLLFGDEAADENAAGQRVQLIEFPVADRAFQAGAGGVVIAVVAIFVLSLGSLAAGLARGGSGDHLIKKAQPRSGLTLGNGIVHLGHIYSRHRQAAVLRRRQNHAATGE